MTPGERVVTLRAELRTVAAQWCAACVELEPLAAELAAVEGQLRAAEGQAGIVDHRPGARELAAEVLHGHLSSLRPSVVFVSSESAAEAVKQLTRSAPPASATAM